MEIFHSYVSLPEGGSEILPQTGNFSQHVCFFLEPRLRDIDKKMVNVSLKMSLLPSQL